MDIQPNNKIRLVNRNDLDALKKNMYLQLVITQ